MHSRARFLAVVAGGVAYPLRVGAQQAELTTLRVTAVPNDDVTPLLYAQQSGLLRRAGIEVQLTRNTSGAAIAAAVAGGSFDIGLASMMALITGHAHGLPFLMVAPSLLALAGDKSTEMVVLADSPIRAPRDLAGKVLATASIRDESWLATKSFIDAAGADSETAKFVEIPQAAVPAALEQKRIDAGMLISPTLDRAMATGHFRALGNPLEAIGKRWLGAAWFSLASYAMQNRDLVDRFARAMLAATIYANAHQAETAPLIIAFTGIDPATAAGLHRATCAEYLDPRDIQPAVDHAARYKILERAFPAQELISPYALKPPR